MNITANPKQSSKRKHIYMWLMVLLTSTFLTISFIVPQSIMVNAFVTGPKIVFYLQMSILLLVTSVGLITNMIYIKAAKINLTDILIVVTLLYILIKQGLSQDDFFSDKLSNYICLTILYLILKTYVTTLNPKQLQQFVYYQILLTAVILLSSSLYGLFQLYDLVNPNDMFFKVTGQFKSPAPYANYLTALLPLTFATYLLYPQGSPHATIIKFISLSATLAGTLILPITYTRAAWFGTVAAALFIIFYKYQVFRFFTIRKTVFALGGLLFTGFLFLLALYHLKPKSADGRLLVWEISTDIIKQNTLTGIGYGNFESRYNTYQATYFAADNRDPQKIELADKVYYPYNIFIQIFTEQGIIGLALFIAILYSIFKQFYKNTFKVQSNAYFGVGVAASIIAIIICGQFSYPFDVLAVHIVFFINLALLSAFNDIEANQIHLKKFSKNFSLIIGILLFSGSITLFLKAKNKFNAYTTWKIYTNENQSSAKFSELYPSLKTDANFRAKYGKLLLDEKKYKEAISILGEANRYMSDPFICINLAEAYIAIKEYNKAEYFLILASNMIPNRLYSKYLLAKLYFNTKQIDKAKEVSQNILSTNPKIPSPAIKEMKDDIRRLIAHSSN
ncbi:O-antigen polymerase [Pseudopedobacter saltans DSM 12145]|uniref:O-antigen polymerase n=1 Tax=Pseudopedobacter saltans (strain ATCC 51119 / DSM 12145 / JCM 21818 / CCUG 39354 / LMG 10337 / NBRC 100064 / NCIMB 13643) TaxID=762903 RepID=F0S4B8_PSESL|nr:O-antigen ligase family protein [Pseudopedobacter saltans]ADY50875.1 O-antigen polymerase [Pseudopedobacter saltans DSM 12145]